MSDETQGPDAATLEAGRIEQYVERRYQRSGGTAFPTVREVARAFGVRRVAVEEAVEEHDNLILTSYFARFPAPLGDHFVETIDPPAAPTGPRAPGE